MENQEWENDTTEEKRLIESHVSKSSKKTFMEKNPNKEVEGTYKEKEVSSSNQQSGQENDVSVDTDHHACLVGYPYHEQIGRVYIHKKKQRNILWKHFFSPQTFCTEAEGIDILWKILFWVGITFAFAAVIVAAFVKEKFEGPDEELVLHLTIAEFVLATISIMISLIKHSLKYHQVIKLQKAIRTNKQTQDDREQSSNRRKLYIALAFIWFCFVLTLLTGFLIMHFFNEDSHKELEYTKYSTVLALFLTVVLDGLINDVINDAHSKAKADQYTLLVHQLTLELKNDSANTKLDDRIKDIEDFLHGSDIFSVRNKKYFIREDRASSGNGRNFIRADRANSCDGNTMEKVLFDNKKDVTIVDLKCHVQAKLENETAATAIDGVKQFPEGPVQDAIDDGIIINMETRSEAGFVVVDIENLIE